MDPRTEVLRKTFSLFNVNPMQKHGANADPEKQDHLRPTQTEMDETEERPQTNVRFAQED